MSNQWFKKFEADKPIGNLIAYDNLVWILSYLDFNKINGSPDFFEGQGYAVMTLADKPALSPYQIAAEADSIRLEDGTWQQQWSIVEKSAAEKTKILADQTNLVTRIKQHKIDTVNDFLPQLEYVDVVDELNAYKAALEAVDLSDPFNVRWPDFPDPSTGIILPF